MFSLSTISPKFTDNTLLEILQKVKPGACVSTWDAEMCGTRGTSFQSELYRLRINGTLKDEPFTVNAFVKALPRNLARRMTFRSPEFYSREIEFLTKIWPAFLELQRKHQVAEPYADVPRCLATFEDGENDFIVMEDLGCSGFRSADRQLEIDLLHCKMALTSFGKLHGLSHALRALEPETFAQLTSHMSDIYYAEASRSWNEGMFELEVNVARDAVERELPGSEVEVRMKEFTKDTRESYSEMAKLSGTMNEFAVIGHGDCWPPNFMYTYGQKGDTAPKGMKIIDFQLVRLGSCALDISFFVYSCTTEELRRDHFDSMLEWYYDGVGHTLSQFHLDALKLFPMATLKEEMKSFAKFGVGTAMEAIPVSIMDEADTTDMDAIEGSVPLTLPEIWKLKPIATQEGRRRLADVFKHAVEQGYL